MDALDAAVIRHLCYGSETFQWDVRASYAKVARALGVDEDTVRSRVGRMERDGLVTGWAISVHPRILGRDGYIIEVEGIEEAHKEEAIRSLRHLDGIYAIFDHYRAGLLMGVHASATALERLTNLVEAICRSPAEAWPTTFPPVDIELNATDWRLVQAMRRAPRRPLAELAALTGSSSRTVQRRLSRLVDGHAVFVMVETDFARITGLVPVHVRVVYSEEGDRDEVRRALRAGGSVIFSDLGGPVALVSYMLESVAAAEELRARLEALPGAKRVRVDVQKSRMMVDGWLDEEIAARVKSH